MDYSISHLCKQFGLARSTLLYYDAIGILKPSCRSLNNYRRYSQADVKRLEQICLYRQTGISLKEIHGFLGSSEGMIRATLEKRLDELNHETTIIRKQQHLILNILQNEELLKRLQIIERDTLVEILKLAGLNEDDMTRLHAKLEEMSPEGHQIFLEALGIAKDEIKEIRKYACSLNEIHNESTDNKEKTL